MGLVMGILAIGLVLLMIWAMALAEWTDQDPGEWLRKQWARWKKPRTPLAGAEPVPVSPAAAVKEEPAAENPVRPSWKPTGKKKAVKKSAVRPAAPVKRLSKTTKSKRKTPK